MSDRVRDLLVRGIAAAKAKSKEEARFYLEWVLRCEDAANDQLVQAWQYLAQITDDPKAKRECFEHVLAYDPADPDARRGMAILKGTLNPEEVLDPDRVAAPSPGPAERPVLARRFVCPQCAGRMSFTPDGIALACAYCGRRDLLIAAADESAMPDEQDVAVALATAKGHVRPVAQQLLKCQGCGALFVLLPQTLSQTCPYCSSPYVVDQTETRESIPPEGVVPFGISQEQAQRALLDWYRCEGFKVLSRDAPPVGAYLPAWTFDVGGQVLWNCLVEVNDAWLPRSGSELVYANDMLVAASHTLSATLTEELSLFQIGGLVPYDPRYLADWPAETYQISVSDASLVARWRTLENARPRIAAGITDTHRDLRLSALRMVIESYRLILLPLWIGRFHFESKEYTVIVNGQSGAVRGEKPLRGVHKWLSNLMGKG